VKQAIKSKYKAHAMRCMRIFKDSQNSFLRIILGGIERFHYDFEKDEYLSEEIKD
jgi:hypothetical protein